MSEIALPSRCDRAAAETLLPEFVAAMGSGRIEIDGRQVSQVSQAMLQLLLAVRRSGEGAAILPSPALLDAAQLTGLSAQLFDEDRT